MIVRSREDGRGFVLVDQYDHGLVSGDFARHWGWRPAPSESAIYAISQHDLAWKELDTEPLWNLEEARPYAFFEYPAAPRLAANVRGVDAIERQDPYAALLCSLHYESFVRNATGVAESSFRAAERERQSRLLFSISEEERERVDDEFSLLRLCDNLSLFLCLNAPGENTYPWFRDGFDYGGTHLTPVWDDSHTLRLEPSPFAQSFEVRIPYREMDERGESLDTGVIEIGIPRT